MQQPRRVQETGCPAVAPFAAAFFLVTSLTIFWTRYNGGLALIWPGTAILSALLVSLPRGRWPAALALFAGLSAVATSLFGLGPRAALPLALVNVFEGWLIAALLVALRPQRDWLERVDGLLVLILIAGVAGPVVAALPGGAIVAAIIGGAWRAHALDWLPGHGLGTLLAFPLAYMAASGTLVDVLTRRRLAEVIAHGLGVAGIAALAFFQTGLPLLFLPVAPLLLASLRLGRTGASVSMVMITGAAALSVQSPAGYFRSFDLPLGSAVLFVQFYLATLLVLALPVSVALRAHKRLLAELEDRKAIRALIEENTDDALLNLDEDGVIRYASPAGARLSGEDDLIGHSLGRFFDPLDEPLVRVALAQAAAAPGETRVIERPVLCGDEQLWLQAKLRAVASDGRHGPLQGYAVTIRDVTERKRTELDAIEAAETDQLTGLPNRRVLIHQLESALQHATQRPFALAILDLDHFKAINDTHGHIVGDAVLREVAAVMRRLSGPSRFFARLGGEEFALVSRLRDFREAEQLCERLRRETAQLIFTAPDGTRFSPTASIGLARIAIPMTAPEALQIADTLLYAAKNSGRNRVRTAPLPRLAETPGRRAA